MPTTTTDPSMHPADYIDQAQAIIGVVGLLVGGYNGDLAFTDQDCHGLALILGQVEDDLKQALAKL